MTQMPIKNLLNILLSFFSISVVFAADSLTFDCRRSEKDYIEEYEMKIVPASGSQKVKIYLDNRDLDQSDSNGSQIVKSVVLTPTTILITMDTSFEAERLQGLSYPAGTVFTQISLNRHSGQLKKVETIQGGILGANLGEGTRVWEEQCALKAEIKQK